MQMSSPFIMECKEILGGAAINGEVKYENLNTNVPREEQSARIGKMIWLLKLGAYLYTLVFLCEGVLYFGTAGNGDIYGVEAKSGEVVFKFESSGTENFLWREDKILLVNLQNKQVF